MLLPMLANTAKMSVSEFQVEEQENFDVAWDRLETMKEHVTNVIPPTPSSINSIKSVLHVSPTGEIKAPTKRAKRTSSIVTGALMTTAEVIEQLIEKEQSKRKKTKTKEEKVMEWAVAAVRAYEETQAKSPPVIRLKKTQTGYAQMPLE